MLGFSNSMTANFVLAVENNQARLREVLAVALLENAALAIESMYHHRIRVAEALLQRYAGLEPLEGLLKQALSEVDWDEVAEHFQAKAKEQHERG